MEEMHSHSHMDQIQVLVSFVTWGPLDSFSSQGMWPAYMQGQCFVSTCHSHLSTSRSRTWRRHGDRVAAVEHRVLCISATERPSEVVGLADFCHLERLCWMALSFGFGFVPACIAKGSIRWLWGVQIPFCHNDYNMVWMWKPESSFSKSEGSWEPMRVTEPSLLPALAVHARTFFSHYSIGTG